MAELRSFIFIDQLQPRTMCYLGTWIRGSLPRSNMAAQIIEVAPGLDIEPLTDVALKHAEVQGGILVVERQFGYLEIHSRSTAAVRAAAAAVLDELGTSADKAMKPQVLAREPLIVDDERAQGAHGRAPASPPRKGRRSSTRQPPVATMRMERASARP